MNPVSVRLTRVIDAAVAAYIGTHIMGGYQFLMKVRILPVHLRRGTLSSRMVPRTTARAIVYVFLGSAEEHILRER